MTRSKSPNRSKTSLAKPCVAVGLGGVEGHRLDEVRAGGLGPVDRLVEAGTGPAGQHHGPASGRDQSGHYGLGDLGGAPEYEH